MAIFEEVKLTWNGRDFVIPPDQVLPCIAKVEDVLTLAQLWRAMERQALPLAKLAQAYGMVLRHAGAVVSDEDVYAALFTSGEMQARARDAVLTLQVMMIPPEHLREKDPGKAVAPDAAPPAG